MYLWQVQAGDGLPELMCVPCVLMVSRAFTFKQQCQRSDQTLRSYLGEIDKIESDSTAEAIDNPENATKVEKTSANNLKENEQFSEIDDTSIDHLDNHLDLDSLPGEIESNSFEEEIELSNLPSSVADEDIQQHLDANVLSSDNELTTTIVTDGDKTMQPSKYGNYFDEIKLDVRNVVPLTDNELPEQSVVETFGKY